MGVAAGPKRPSVHTYLERRLPIHGKLYPNTYNATAKRWLHHAQQLEYEYKYTYRERTLFGMSEPWLPMLDIPDLCKAMPSNFSRAVGRLRHRACSRLRFARRREPGGLLCAVAWVFQGLRFVAAE